MKKNPNLSVIANVILADVFAAMQNAEECGGPEGEDYVCLMEAIAAEAQERIAAFRANN